MPLVIHASESCAFEGNQKILAETEIWVRMPGNREKLEGLSRATLYKVIRDRSRGVVSISLKEPGTERGIRLLGLRSLRAYLTRLAIEQNAPAQLAGGSQRDRGASPAANINFR
jgi:hypothetical protein